jgi:hypothetical protein
MPGTVRHARLDSPTARAKLKKGRQPHWQALQPRTHLGYQRHKGTLAGRWLLRRHLGANSYRILGLGIADDIRRGSPWPFLKTIRNEKSATGGGIGGPRSSEVVTGRISQPSVIAYRTELTSEQNENVLSGLRSARGFPDVVSTQPTIGRGSARGGSGSGYCGLWRRRAGSGQGADRRQPLSRKRSGKTEGGGLDGLCARPIAAT